MRILGVRTNSMRDGKPDYVNPSDMWRIQRPLEILRKNTNWKIDIVTEWVDPKKNFEAECNRLLKNYDAIYFSYTRNAKAYCALKILENHGIKIAMDVDDFLFTIPDSNPAKMHLYEGSEDFFNLQRIIEDISHLTVTTPTLKQKYSEYANGKITVIPNYISTEFYHHEKKNNGDRVVIGYVGGTSHHGDFHKSGLLQAIEKVLRMRPNAIFHCVGMPVIGYKLPKGQYKFTPGALQGVNAWQKLYASLDFDIMTAPLDDNIFNTCKSDIKYQEAALAHVPLITSNVHCYAHCKHTLKAKNESEWIEKLLYLIDNPVERLKMAENAMEDVSRMTLEKNWKVYKSYFERLKNG